MFHSTFYRYCDCDHERDIIIIHLNDFNTNIIFTFQGKDKYIPCIVTNIGPVKYDYPEAIVINDDKAKELFNYYISNIDHIIEEKKIKDYSYEEILKVRAMISYYRSYICKLTVRLERFNTRLDECQSDILKSKFSLLKGSPYIKIRSNSDAEYKYLIVKSYCDDDSLYYTNITGYLPNLEKVTLPFDMRTAELETISKEEFLQYKQKIDEDAISQLESLLS